MIKNVEVLEGFPDWPHNFIDLSLFLMWKVNNYFVMQVHIQESIF